MPLYAVDPIPTVCTISPTLLSIVLTVTSQSVPGAMKGTPFIVRVSFTAYPEPASTMSMLVIVAAAPTVTSAVAP